MKILKNLPHKTTLNNHLLPIIFCVLIGSSIWASAPLLSTYDADSIGYLNFEPHRTSMYPLFLTAMSIFRDQITSVIVVQSSIYVISAYFLLWSLIRYLGSILICVSVGLGLTLNLYLQSFHTVILTESLTFSLMNILGGLLIALCCGSKARSLLPFLALGVAVGLLSTIRPALITLAPATLMFTALLCWDKKLSFRNRALLVTASIFSLMICDKVVRHIYHPEPASQVAEVMIGKASILTTLNDFQTPTRLSNNNQSLIKKIDTLFGPYDAWLNESPDILQASNLRANIEVYGQHHAIKALQKNDPTFTSPTRDEMITIGKETILANLAGYTKISIGYLLELWSVQSLAFSHKVFGNNLPNFENSELNQILPNVAFKGSALDPESRHPVNDLSLLVFPTFALLGLFSIFTAIVSWALVIFRALKALKHSSNELLLVASFQLFGWSNLVFVAFVNIPTPRYLMPHFAGFLISAAIVLFGILKLQKHKFCLRSNRDAPQ